MIDTLERLKQWGCDITGSLPRFLEDQEFMLDCIVEVSEDPAFETLGEALMQNNTEKAFEAAHTLKGILANTGLTPLTEIIVTIVEPLRRGNGEGLMQPYAALIQKRKELLDLLHKQ